MPRADDPLLAGLVDDAALFPPGNAPMADGLAAHAALRAGPVAAAVGPYLCPVSRVDELLTALPADQELGLSLVVDVAGEASHHALRAVAADGRVLLVGVEAPLSLLGDDAAAIGANLSRLPGATGFLEVARDDIGGGLDVVAATGWHAAKLRTGGVTPQAHPDEDELAAFLIECVRRQQPFKLTAGLHHAVRATTTEGFEQHGVLNVLVAVWLARGGAAPAAVTHVLTERDGAQLAREVLVWTRREAAAVRSLFRSFGCCGVTEPLDELRALGVLDDEERL